MRFFEVQAAKRGGRVEEGAERLLKRSSEVGYVEGRSGNSREVRKRVSSFSKRLRGRRRRIEMRLK